MGSTFHYAFNQKKEVWAITLGRQLRLHWHLHSFVVSQDLAMNTYSSLRTPPFGNYPHHLNAFQDILRLRLLEQRSHGNAGFSKQSSSIHCKYYQVTPLPQIKRKLGNGLTCILRSKSFYCFTNKVDLFRKIKKRSYRNLFLMN